MSRRNKNKGRDRVVASIWILLILVMMGLILIGCDGDNDSADGDNPDGDNPDGDEPDGDEPDGDDPDGDDPDGDDPDGDDPDGDDPDGDDPDGDDPDGDNPDGDDPSDSISPEIQNVQVAIAGEFSSSFSLNESDVVRVLPVAAEAEFTVQASDNVTDREQLVVDVVDIEGGSAPNVVSRNYRNGLWRVTVELTSGSRVGVQVTDEAGNSGEHSYVLVLPELLEALVGDWEERLFQKNGSSHSTYQRNQRTFASDLSWSGSILNEAFVQAGIYAGDDSDLEISETTHQNGDTPDDTDSSTTEWKREAVYHVDGVYFSDRPYTRTAGTVGNVVGTWERSYAYYLPDGADLELAEDVTETLTLAGDDSFNFNHSGTRYTSGGEEAISETKSGSWFVDPNEDYSDNYGDFLVFTTDTVDGEALASTIEDCELHVIRNGRLLVRPSIRLGDPVDPAAR